MSGIDDLSVFLSSMQPTLRDGEFVFISRPGASYGDGAELDPVAAIVEYEGLTLVLPRERADVSGVPYNGTFRMVTLQVHSSLVAVGLTAAVSAALAQRGISANVVAAFYHDHVFVPTERADEAVDALAALAFAAEAPSVLPPTPPKG